ncbi:MAG TPA: response regulator [Planctomycetaceae bacterium]|jgi:CheY-like chemotaxis protein|nr:response regulator [Planctomycetaceae bacterium]
MHNPLPILIAEDNEDDFFCFRRAARMAGIHNPILRFRDGSELIGFLEQSMPADATRETPLLTFIDLAMPLVSGFEVLTWLRTHRPNQFFPIVLSGSRREEDVRKAYDLGAEEYLTKPLTPLLLAALAARPAAEFARH